MKTTEEYFQEFYNEMRYQLEQGVNANFTRANKIWAKYEASQSAQADELATLRAQLAEARELISEAKIEIGFTLHGNTQPSISTYDKLTAYLNVTTA